MVSSPRIGYELLFLAYASTHASLERRYRDEQKRIPRNIDTQYEGMELH